MLRFLVSFYLLFISFKFIVLSSTYLLYIFLICHEISPFCILHITRFHQILILSEVFLFLLFTLCIFSIWSILFLLFFSSSVFVIFIYVLLFDFLMFSRFHSPLRLELTFQTLPTSPFVFRLLCHSKQKRSFIDSQTINIIAGVWYLRRKPCHPSSNIKNQLKILKKSTAIALVR